MAKITMEEIEEAINHARESVNYDTKEYTLELLHSKFNRYIEENKETEIFVPFYQRKFVWDDKRQSKFIESMLLGLPIPPMYFAEMEDGILEVIDGSQRIRTVDSFLSGKLKLKGLQTLPELNKLTFNDFSHARKRKINNVSMRAIVVYNFDKDEMGIRHEIFERLNTGGEILKKMEVKKGAKQGPFIKLIYEDCAEYSLFNELCGFTRQDELRAYKEEFLVKLFAFSNDMEFDGYINNYLDSYIEKANEDLKVEGVYDDCLEWFKNLIKFVDKNELIQNISINRKNRLLAIFIGSEMARLTIDGDGKEAYDENGFIITDGLFSNHNPKIDLYTPDFLENATSSSFRALKINSELVRDMIIEAADE